MGTYVLSVKYAISEMASKTFILRLNVVCKSSKFLYYLQNWIGILKSRYSIHFCCDFRMFHLLSNSKMVAAEGIFFDNGKRRHMMFYIDFWRALMLKTFWPVESGMLQAHGGASKKNLIFFVTSTHRVTLPVKILSFEVDKPAASFVRKWGPLKKSTLQRTYLPLHDECTMVRHRR